MWMLVVWVKSHPNIQTHMPKIKRASFCRQSYVGVIWHRWNKPPLRLRGQGGGGEGCFLFLMVRLAWQSCACSDLLTCNLLPGYPFPRLKLDNSLPNNWCVRQSPPQAESHTFGEGLPCPSPIPDHPSAVPFPFSTIASSDLKWRSGDRVATRQSQLTDRKSKGQGQGRWSLLCLLVTVSDSERVAYWTKLHCEQGESTSYDGEYFPLSLYGNGGDSIY